MELKKTEHTYRKDFLKVLEENLTQKGLAVYDELTYKTIDGKFTKIPDVVIVDKSKIKDREKYVEISWNGVVCIVETKQKDVAEGFIQSQEYVSLLEPTVGKIPYCFSTNFTQVYGCDYTELINKIGRKKFAETISVQSIQSTGSFIAKSILGITKQLRPIGEDDKLLIETLTSAVNVIASITDTLAVEEIENLTDMFFAKTIDVKILEDEELKAEYNTVVKKSAAYLLVNQILFYHLLSKKAGYVELTEIYNVSRLQQLFNKVLEKDYAPIFGSKIIDALSDDAVPIINMVIRTVASLQFENIRHDIIGKIFHGLIPEKIRKRIAAYFTGNPAASLLCYLTIDRGDDLIIDPACGSGTFLVEAYKRKEHYQKSEASKIRLHKKLLNEIWGIDICLFSGHLAAVHLAIQSPNIYSEKENILIDDAFMNRPGYKIQSLLTTIERQDKVIQNSKVQLPNKFDVLLMNPPFTFSRRMSKKYKQFLNKVMKDKKLDKYVKGQFGLHLYFLLHTEEFLKNGGRLGCVLPESMLQNVETATILDFLLENFKITHLIESDAQTTFSEQCDFKEILLVATKAKDTEYSVAFIKLKKELTLENSIRLAKKIKTPSEDYIDEEVDIKLISKDELKKEKHWVRYFRKSETLEKIRLTAGEKICKGKDVFPSTNLGVRRGFYIYGKNFFILPNDYWTISNKSKDFIEINEKSTADKLKIQRKYLIPTLRSPDDNKFEIFPKTGYYFVNIPPKYKDKFDSNLRKYIEWGIKLKDEEMPAKKMYGSGKFWYSNIYYQFNKSFGDICVPEKFMPKNRGVAAYFLDNLHKISDKEKITAATASFYFLDTGDRDKNLCLVAWFNSTIGLAHRYEYRAVLGSASERLSGEQFQRLDALNVNNLSKDEIKKINNSLKKMKKPLPYLINQLNMEERNELDKIILEVLGFKGKEVDMIKDELKTILKNWIGSHPQKKLEVSFS